MWGLWSWGHLLSRITCLQAFGQTDVITVSDRATEISCLFTMNIMFSYKQGDHKGRVAKIREKVLLIHCMHCTYGCMWPVIWPPALPLPHNHSIIAVLPCEPVVIYPGQWTCNCVKIFTALWNSIWRVSNWGAVVCGVKNLGFLLCWWLYLQCLLIRRGTNYEEQLSESFWTTPAEANCSI